MQIAFELSMPNVGSWNGKWSGEGKCYAIVRAVPTKRAVEILKQGSYYYRWDDGWGASVRVSAPDRSQAGKLKRKSQGFCGYDWMVDSIIQHGKILGSHEVPLEATV